MTSHHQPKPNDQLILDAFERGAPPGGLFCIAAVSSAGKHCLQVRKADYSMIGLSPKLQNADVAVTLREEGYSASIYPLRATNAVNVPLDMAEALKRCHVALVDEALQNARQLPRQQRRIRKKARKKKRPRQTAPLKRQQTRMHDRKKKNRGD